ncbi:MAG TPA: tetratricopeptide repeat protein [Ktedonobacteraceae bacterium]|nr:tetratricopeptide repeat protein [Ktedonobacteraceae bacterium]
MDDAMSRCQRLLTTFPDALEVQRLLGEVHMAQGHLEEAQQIFDWILTNDPENVIVYCDRALMSERMSDIETALDCYQQAYELSRANPQIRQEFNQLSARSGQPGFMFSRAGLARLYMRGDLLIQAIQEWEAVLAGTPGRLDARTGLLEAYWREGVYDQVEQQANKILDEIPGCVKALLLLAHVTAPHNIQRAKTLLQQAEVLDPELNMATGLFSELTANHGNDPFLALLKKEPIIFADAANGNSVPVGTAVEANGSLSPVPASDSHHAWNNMESWSELDTLSIPQPEAPAMQSSSSFATWSENTLQNADQWTPMNAARENQNEIETWQEPQALDEDFDPTILEQQPWYQAEQDQLSIPPEAASTWDNLSPINHAEPATTDTWRASDQDADLRTPPAWLDILTRGERTQASKAEASPPVPSTNRQEPVENVSTAQPELEPDYASQIPWEQTSPANPEQQEEQPVFFATGDNDDDAGWPEWLKSLGAATLDESEIEEAAPPVPEPQDSPLLHEHPADVPEPEPQLIPNEPWTAMIDQTLSEQEEQTMLTLENLEQDLRSQGFVPLEPGMLSAIAQEPDTQEPTLSTALAQLANFPSRPQTNEDVPSTEAAESSRPVEPPQVPEITGFVPETVAAHTQPAPVEPLWTAEVPEMVHEQLADVMISPPPLIEQPVLQSNNAAETPAQSGPPVATPHAETPPDQVFASVASSNSGLVEGNALTSAYRADSLLEDDLETTMKRPAIRLPPMQRPGIRGDIAHLTNKGRPGERGAGSKTPDSDLSNKERLLKGYQYQLAGAYDDAMQEYRIIIRNAPELLGEVVSNLRALLKLAPKYSAGFRVLGDAYMRQGEYLQAMEAYNKALTIAKKAKSQSN